MKIIDRSSLLYSGIVFAFVLLLAPTLSFANSSSAHSGQPNVGDFVPNQVVVKLQPGESIEAILNETSHSLLETILLSGNIYLLETTTDAQAAAKALDKDKRIFYAELNYLVDVPEANPTGSWSWGSADLLTSTEANPTGSWSWGGASDAPLNNQYAFDMIGLADAQAPSLGAGVTIAVLDTGAQLDHPLYASQLSSVQYDFVDDDDDASEMFDGIDEDGDGLIDEAAGHGTHVSGIIHQVAPQATIMPIRVLDSDGRGNLFTLVEAIHFSAENNANIINLSLGIPFKSDLLDDAVQDARHVGAVVIAAAGNSGIDTPQYPAAFKNVIAVTAHDEMGALADFANYGTWVDIAAPGKSIYSAYPVDGYAWWSGTSMATPVVAGAAALMWDDVNLHGSSSNAVLLTQALGLQAGAAQSGNIPLLSLATD